MSGVGACYSSVSLKTCLNVTSALSTSYQPYRQETASNLLSTYEVSIFGNVTADAPCTVHAATGTAGYFPYLWTFTSPGTSLLSIYPYNYGLSGNGDSSVSTRFNISCATMAVVSIKPVAGAVTAFRTGFLSASYIPPLITDVFEPRDFIMKVGSWEVFKFYETLSSVHSRTVPSLNYSTSASVTFPLRMSSNESSCQSLVEPFGSCTRTSCTFSVQFQTCNLGEIAEVTIQGLSAPSCRVSNGELCTLAFPRPSSVRSLRFVAISGQETVYSSIFEVGPPNSLTDWSCTPACGIPYVENWPAAARWIVVIILLCITYYLLAKASRVIAMMIVKMREATADHVSSIQTVYSTILSCLPFRNKPSKVVPDASSSDSDLESPPPQKKPKNTTSQRAKPTIVASVKQALSGKVRHPKGTKQMVVLGLLCLSTACQALIDTDGIIPVPIDYANVDCTNLPLSISDLSVVDGSGYLDTILTIDIEMSRGASLCYSTNYSLADTPNIEMVVLAQHAVIATKEPQFQVGLPHIVSVVSCGCPSGGSHYCDAAHFPASCPNGDCLYYSFLGPGDDCPLPGMGHYCIIFYLLDDADTLCDIYPLGEPTFHGVIQTTVGEVNRVSVIPMNDHSWHDIDGFGQIRQVGTFVDPDFYATLYGTVYNCGSGAFWLPTPTPSIGMYGSSGDMSKYQYTPTSGWKTDWNSFIGSVQMNAYSCNQVNVSVTFTAPNFGLLAVDLDSNVDNHFKSIGSVQFINNEMVLDIFQGPNTLFELNLNSTPLFHFDPASLTILSVVGFGGPNTTHAGLTVNVTVIKSGEISIYLNGNPSTNTLSRDTRFLSLSYVPSSLVEKVNLTICDLFNTQCVNAINDVTFEQYIPVVYTSDSNTDQHDIKSTDKNFFDDGLGSNFRFGKLFGLGLKGWIDFIITLAIITVTAVAAILIGRWLYMRNKAKQLQRLSKSY
jgi:hypothetical protein